MLARLGVSGGRTTSAMRSSGNLRPSWTSTQSSPIRQGHTMASVGNFTQRWADEPDVQRSAGRAFTVVNDNVQEIPHQADRERPSSMAQSLALRRIQRANQRAGRSNSMVLYRHGSITPLTHPGEGAAEGGGDLDLSEHTSPHLRDAAELSRQSGLPGIAVMAPVAPRNYPTAHLPGELNEKPDRTQATLLQGAQRMGIPVHAVGHSWGGAETVNTVSGLPEEVQQNTTVHFAGGATWPTRQEELKKHLAGLRSPVNLYKGRWDPVTHFGGAYGYASGEPVTDRAGVELHRTTGGHGFGSSYLPAVSEQIRNSEDGKRVSEKE
jgi:hypothetical protein